MDESGDRSAQCSLPVGPGQPVGQRVDASRLRGQEGVGNLNPVKIQYATTAGPGCLARLIESRV